MKSTNQPHETQQELTKITGAIDRFFQNVHLATILNQIRIRSLASGESVGWVQSMMGHASLRMIQEHYFRFILNLTHEDGSAFTKKFGSRFEKITPNPPHPGGS